MVDFTGGTWRSLIDGSEVSAIPDSDLWYSINEGSGQTFTDSNGDSDGDLVGGTWVEDSDFYDGWYVDLDSTDDHVLVGGGSNGDTSILSPNNDWSIGIQLNVETKLTDRSGRPVIWSWSGGEIFTLGAGGSSTTGLVGVEYFDGSDFQDSVGFSEPDAPYRLGILCRWDSGTESLDIYYDNTEGTEDFQDDANSDGTDGFRIGSNTANDDNLNEGIDAFAVWNSERIDPDDYFSVL